MEGLNLSKCGFCNETTPVTGQEYIISIIICYVPFTAWEIQLPDESSKSISSFHQRVEVSKLMPLEDCEHYTKLQLAS
jgi:hypothetical protein